MVTRNLTFKSSNLGSNVKLMLCFMPPRRDLFVNHFPVAWKVATLAGVGNSVLDVTWTPDLAFSAGQIGSDGLVTAENYTLIHAGETTTLQLDTSVSPPIYHFTEPMHRPGLETTMAVNGTNCATPIGLGFISGINTRYEVMENVFVYPSVSPGLAVAGETITPILSAYIGLEYEGGQMLKTDILSAKPLWEQDLMTLGAQTTIIVKKNANGTYGAVEQPPRHEPGSELPMMSNSIDSGLLVGKRGDPTTMYKNIAASHSIDREGLTGMRQRAFNATLSFSNIEAVSRGLKVIANQLLGNGYSVKFIVKDGDTDVRISLGLPFGTSCNQAEKEVSGIVESYGFPGRAAIKDRSGELSVRLASSFSYWADINPASTEWYTGGNSRTRYDGAGIGLAINGVPDDVFNLDIRSGPDYANGNGSGNTGKRDSIAAYSPGMLGGDVGLSAKPGYGKTRTLGRKVSSVSLADFPLA